MYTLAIILMVIGFYSLYNTSQRALLRKDSISTWLQDHTRLSKIIGLICLFMAFYLFVTVLGLGAGVFTGSVILMTISSSIIILSPLTLSKKH